MANRFLIVCGGSGVGLLGQRHALNVDGEIHMDVRAEVDNARAQRDPENRSRNLEIDYPPVMGSTLSLFHDMRQRIGRSVPPNSSYAKHTEVFTSIPIALPLKDGLGQMPALGGGAIREAINLQNLDALLFDMIHRWRADVYTPLEVWIVSSMCGGTGAGTRRFVAERLAHILSFIPGVRLDLKFICIGALTYRDINPVRTRLNTFFGVAADAALRVRLPQQYADKGVGISTMWFYAEVPPVGVGSIAVKPRAKLIEMACKAIMDAQTQKTLATIAANCDGIGLARVGYWTKEFAEQVRYAEALKGLVNKLHQLIKPDEYTKYVAGRSEPVFSPGDEFLRLKDGLRPEFLAKMLRAGWQFPRYDERRASIQTWKDAIDALIEPDKVDRLVTNFLMAPLEGGQPEPLTVPGGEVTAYTPQWFNDVEKAHQVRAWAKHMLEREKEGLLVKLHSAAKECSDACRGFGRSADARAKDLTTPLREFFVTLVQVVRWQELQKAAEVWLDGTLKGAKQILALAEEARRGLPESREVPVIAAELYDPIEDGSARTWLELLADAVARNNPRIFQEQVLKGATGLTRLGLTSVLDLPANAHIDTIREELRQPGKVKLGEQVLRAEWWQAVRPFQPQEGGYTLGHRVLPKLEQTTTNELGDGDKDTGLKYIYAGMGMLGLNVLAFDSVSIASAGDNVTSPAYLLRPFVLLVREHLQQPSKLPFLLAAGVGGEPLYRPALKEAGLTDAELDTLAEFYELID